MSYSDCARDFTGMILAIISVPIPSPALLILPTSMNLRSLFASLLIVAAFTFAISPLSAGDADWPQWRGPNRDGHAAPQSLLDAWPKDGPAVKWQSDAAGRGYSAVAIADGRLYTWGRPNRVVLQSV